MGDSLTLPLSEVYVDHPDIDDNQKDEDLEHGVVNEEDREDLDTIGRVIPFDQHDYPFDHPQDPHRANCSTPRRLTGAAKGVTRSEGAGDEGGLEAPQGVSTAVTEMTTTRYRIPLDATVPVVRRRRVETARMLTLGGALYLATLTGWMGVFRVRSGVFGRTNML